MKFPISLRRSSERGKLTEPSTPQPPVSVQLSSPQSARAARRRRITRRSLAAIGSVAMCLLLPLMTIQIMLYRQNLAMARERFPVSPTFTARDRILILAPHCDDETLGAGGTIAAARAAKVPVRIVFLTNGDGSRSTQIAEGARHLSLRGGGSYQQLARLRQREAVAAARELGVAARDVVFLGYPDGGTQALWETHWSPRNLYRSPYTGTDHSPYPNSRTRHAPYCGAQVLRDVTAVVADWKPTVVITTNPSDTHPDHWAAYAYAAAALESLRLKPSTQAWARRVQLLTFLVHRGWWPAPHGYHPDQQLAPPASLKDIGTRWTQAPLDNRARLAKKAALNRYVSQLAFTPQFLRGFLRRNELFGMVPIGEQKAIGSRQKTEIAHPASRIPHPASLEVRDSVHDSALHDVWPAADLRGLTVTATGSTAGAAPDALDVRIRLAKPPSRRLRYELSLHTISDAGEIVTTRAHSMRIRQQGGAWRCVLTSGDDVIVPARATPHGFEIKLPYAVLNLARPPAALLISAGAYVGRTRLDQTETGTLRLELPEKTRRQYRSPLRAVTG